MNKKERKYRKSFDNQLRDTGYTKEEKEIIYDLCKPNFEEYKEKNIILHVGKKGIEQWNKMFNDLT